MIDDEKLCNVISTCLTTVLTRAYSKIIKNTDQVQRNCIIPFLGFAKQLHFLKNYSSRLDPMMNDL